jgi:SnoaL-like protein
MSVEATSQEHRAASATTDPARIRELLLANLFAVFSERDLERRLQVIERNYTEDVIWSDPDRTTHGHEEMNEEAQKLLDRMPDLVFSAAGPVHVSRNLGLLAFNLGVPEQPPTVSGIDVAVVRDGRIARLYTLVNAEG